ncbi:MAG TPA: cupin domain-containing protein [Polyangia bacterium]
MLLAHGALAQKPAPSGGAVKLKLPPLPPSMLEGLTAQLADAAWTPASKVDAKFPPGAEVALIGTDPVSTAPTFYMRMKPGYKVPLHAHEHLEYDTMVAGKGTLTLNGKKIAATPGTFVIVASKVKHEFSCDSRVACVFVVRRSGPTEFIWGAK